MRAIVFDSFGGPLRVAEVPRPTCPPDGVVLRVQATGLCRSDWHAWMGHDADVTLPHVPGHEFAGVIDEVGVAVRGWSVGQRVSAPFVFACGRCAVCLCGEHQVCERQEQAGFTHAGSFAEFVVVDRAEINLIALPDHVDADTAAVLGCRFGTAYRAIRQVARVHAGETVAVFGCGGVGLSAVMIAAASGAEVIAADVSVAALDLASSFGAHRTVRVGVDEPLAEVADVAIDALGATATLRAGVMSLRRRGRHVQVGLLAGADADPRVPMARVISHELSLLGSHGMAAHAYPRMLAEIASGRLAPQRMIARRIALEAVPQALATMDASPQPGVTIIHP